LQDQEFLLFTLSINKEEANQNLCIFGGPDHLEFSYHVVEGEFRVQLRGPILFKKNDLNEKKKKRKCIGDGK